MTQGGQKEFHDVCFLQVAESEKGKGEVTAIRRSGDNEGAGFPR